METIMIGFRVKGSCCLEFNWLRFRVSGCRVYRDTSACLSSLVTILAMSCLAHQDLIKLLYWRSCCVGESKRGS